jgi:hypothetical protein
VYVQTPPELRGKLEEVAAKAGVTPQVWVRDHLAQEFGVVLPPVTKRVKYASEEEKKTALKERSKAKNELIKKLLADYQAAQEGGGGSRCVTGWRLCTRGVQSAVAGALRRGAPLGTKVLGGALCFGVFS